MFLDTPLPPEEPAGENPPDGAIVDYFLKRRASEVTLQIFDGANEIRTFSSGDGPERLDPDSLWYPTYWIRPPERLSTSPGHHRFVWDLRYPPPPGTSRGLSIAAVRNRTPSGPLGPFVPPGAYTIRLTADGTVLERQVEVRLDPRVDLSDEDLQLQTESSLACYRGYLELQSIRESIDASGAERPEAWMRFRGEGSPDEPDTLYGSITESSPVDETVVGLQEKCLYLLKLLQQADARPTDQALAAVEKLQERLRVLTERWEELRR
jgi:hypothetical protein